MEAYIAAMSLLKRLASKVLVAGFLVVHTSSCCLWTPFMTCLYGVASKHTFGRPQQKGCGLRIHKQIGYTDCEAALETQLVAAYHQAVRLANTVGGKSACSCHTQVMLICYHPYQLTPHHAYHFVNLIVTGNWAIEAGVLLQRVCVCRLQWEDVTVGQALALTAKAPSTSEPSHRRSVSSVRAVPRHCRAADMLLS